MRGKNLLWISLICMLALSVGIANAKPALAKVEIDPSSITGISPGTIFPIEVKIRDVEGLSAWEVKLSVNPLVLKPLPPVTEGTFLSDVGPTYFKVYFSVLGDYVLVGCMLLTPVTASGDGTLMSMSFMCIGAGASKIRLDAKLLDINLNPIPHNEHDCQVTQRSIVEVTDRGEEAQRFSISGEEDQYNTLYATLENRGEDGVYARAVFIGYALDGSMIKGESTTMYIPPEEAVDGDWDFDALEYGEGTYYFTAYAEFAYTEGGEFYRGAKEKTLSFVVIP